MLQDGSFHLWTNAWVASVTGTRLQWRRVMLAVVKTRSGTVVTFTTFIDKTLRCLCFGSPYATDHESPVRPSTRAGPASGWPVGASLESPGLPSARRDRANLDAAVAG